MFRAVRVLGLLPHVHYVLAYDQETIPDVLSTTPIADKHGARAVAFLEKIITLRLEQPPARLEQLRRFGQGRPLTWHRRRIACEGSESGLS